jgi:adenylate cyclase
MRGSERSQYEREFYLQISKIDRTRAKWMAIVIAALLGLFLAVVVAYPWVSGHAILLSPAARAWNVAILTLALAFEVGQYGLIGYLMTRQREVPRLARYWHAFFEASLPTAFIAIVGHDVDPIVGLNSPPLLAYSIFILISTLRLDATLSSFTGIVAGLEYILLSRSLLPAPPSHYLVYQLADTPMYIAKGAMLAILGVGAGVIGRQLRLRVLAAFDSVAEQDRIRKVFGQHVSPEVVDALLNQPIEMNSEVRHACVMFLDIRNFTTFSEKRSPEEVVAYLNQLFEFMIETINRHNGIINKFLGDGFMAVFGAPLPDGRACQNAVAAALEIARRIDELNAAGAIPSTRIGIGLHAGEVVTGSVGSPARKEYTLIGDVVNLASRIEGLNKQMESRILISDQVYRELHDVPASATSRETIIVKGRTEPVQIYQLA